MSTVLRNKVVYLWIPMVWLLFSSTSNFHIFIFLSTILCYPYCKISSTKNDPQWKHQIFHSLSSVHKTGMIHHIDHYKSIHSFLTLTNKDTDNQQFFKLRNIGCPMQFKCSGSLVIDFHIYIYILHDFGSLFLSENCVVMPFKVIDKREVAAAAAATRSCISCAFRASFGATNAM